jgi:hypothetical protein
MTKFNFSKNALYSALINNAMEIEVTTRDGSKEIVDEETFVAFFENEIERNTRKNKSKSTKPTAKQIENEEIKANIIEYMRSVGTPVTISNIVKDFNNEYSIPKISALVKQLKDNGQVSREEIKRVAYFKVVE